MRRVMKASRAKDLREWRFDVRATYSERYLGGCHLRDLAAVVHAEAS